MVTASTSGEALAADGTIFVTVGMDHHRFDRLMDWVEAWVSRRRLPVAVVVQHGTSRAPEGVHAVQFVDHNEMQRLLDGSLAVVTSCGPGTTMGAREAGILPIVVPRRPELNEHVDGHQLAFARHLGEHGLAVVCEQQEALTAALDAALTDPGRYQLAEVSREAAGIDRIAELVDALVIDRTARRRRR